MFLKVYILLIMTVPKSVYGNILKSIDLSGGSDKEWPWFKKFKYFFQKLQGFQT